MWVMFAWARRFGDEFRNYYFLLSFLFVWIFVTIFFGPAHLIGRVSVIVHPASILYIFPVGSFYGNKVTDEFSDRLWCQCPRPIPAGLGNLRADVSDPANGCEWLVTCIIISIPCQHVGLCPGRGGCGRGPRTTRAECIAFAEDPEIDSGVD